LPKKTKRKKEINRFLSLFEDFFDDSPALLNSQLQLQLQFFASHLRRRWLHHKNKQAGLVCVNKLTFGRIMSCVYHLVNLL